MENSMQLNNLPDRLLTAVEIAGVLSISRAFAYKLMKRGDIRTVFTAGARRVRPEDLQTFIKSNLNPQTAQEILK